MVDIISFNLSYPYVILLFFEIGLEKKSPVLDAMLLRLLGWIRTMA